MGLFSKLFGSKTDTEQFKTTVLDLFSTKFQTLGDMTENNVVQESVHSITKHCSKLTLQHRSKDADGNSKSGRVSLNEILQYSPNPTENGADFLEKMMWHYLMDNHTFVYFKFKPANALTGKEILDSMWVLNPYNVRVNVKESGGVYLTFNINNEQQRITTSIDNVAVIKRMVGKDEFFGATNEAISKIISIIDTNYQGIEASIVNSAVIRFIIESATVLNPEKRKEKAAQFRDEYLAATKNGGVIYSDISSKITPIQDNSKTANYKEMELFNESVRNYFGTNGKIIQGNYSDTEWNSFYESTIEPFIHKVELEFTKKLLTPTERGHRNTIDVVVNKLQSISLTSRLAIIKDTSQFGLLSINEMRELLYLPPVDGGEKRQVSLNYVDSDKQDQYQLDESKKKKKKASEK